MLNYVLVPGLDCIPVSLIKMKVLEFTFMIHILLPMPFLAVIT